MTSRSRNNTEHKAMPVVASRGTMTGTIDQVHIANIDGSINISLPQAIATTSSPEFAGINLTSPSNQLRITGNGTVSMNFPMTGAHYTLTVPTMADCDFVMNAGDQLIGGTKTFTNGIILPTTSGIATPLSDYSEFTIPQTWQGPMVATAGDIGVTVIGRLVTLQFPAVTSLGNNIATGIFASNAIPLWIRPAEQQRVPMIVNNGGTIVFGTVAINNTGSILISAGPSVPFAATRGTIGFTSMAVSYLRSLTPVEEVQEPADDVDDVDDWDHT